MTSKKTILIATTILALSSITAFWDYKEIDCSTNPAFGANSCWQCFDWWAKKTWESLWILSDDWLNMGSTEQVFLKEENTDKPTMVNLNEANVTWTQTVAPEDFWEFTPELEKLKSTDDSWYVLPAWQKVTWLQSKIDATYTLSKNDSTEWSDIGMMIYPIKIHNMVSWAPSVESKEHKECVLFKSGKPTEMKAAPAPVAPAKLPKTWPEHIILAFMALLIAFSIVKLRKKA